MTELAPRRWTEINIFEDRVDRWISDRPSPIPHRASPASWAAIQHHTTRGEPLAATTAELDHLHRGCTGTNRPHNDLPITVLGLPVVEITDWPDWL